VATHSLKPVATVRTEPADDQAADYSKTPALTVVALFCSVERGYPERSTPGADETAMAAESSVRVLSHILDACRCISCDVAFLQDFAGKPERTDFPKQCTSFVPAETQNRFALPNPA
jgi:hypothetical protein